MSSFLQILVDGQPLDLAPDEEKNFYLTKQVHDITNLETRNASFSKSIALPLTPRNQKILGFNVPALDRYSDSPVSNIPCDVQIKGVPMIDDAFLLLGVQDTNNGILNVQVVGGTALFFQQLKSVPINDLDFSEYDFPLTLSGIAPIVNVDSGVLYANSIWYDNPSRLQMEGINGFEPTAGANYLDNQELGESGFFMYCKTVLEKIFSNLDNITVDMSKMNQQFDDVVFAVPVPIIHDAFNATDGDFAEVATPSSVFDTNYDKIVSWATINSDDSGLFNGTDSFTIAKKAYYVIKASFDVFRNKNYPYYTIIQIYVNGALYDDRRFEYAGDSNVECSITTSATLNIGDVVLVKIANAQEAYIVDNSDGIFSVEAQGAGRGTYVNVSGMLPDITQRQFVKEMFKLFNIVPTQESNLVTLNYFEDIQNAEPVVLGLNKKLQTTVQSTLSSYGKNNIVKYADDDNVERLDANGEFPVNSLTIADELIKIESLFSATDQTTIPNKFLTVPNYSCELWIVTDNKITVNKSSPNYSTADRNNIKVGDFIYLIGSATVRKRVIAVTDDFSGICDANFESSHPEFDFQHWRYTKKDIGIHLAMVEKTPYRMQVWDGTNVQNYDNSYSVDFSGLRWIDLQDQYYQLLQDMAFKPFVVIGWMDFGVLKYLKINGLQPIYVKEFDAYFYANKIEQWKYNGSTRVELIEMPI